MFASKTYSRFLVVPMQELFCALTLAHAVCVLAVKTEKKTVQFSEDIQVETIEPEQEPVYIDEVSCLL